MKYITTTLILIVGFQFTICAETFFFEHFYNEESIFSGIPKKTNHNIMLERFSKLDSELNLEKNLGTIRLETGEKLTLGKIKFLMSKPNFSVYNAEPYDGYVGNGYSLNTTRFASFVLVLKYDLFTQPQKLTIVNNNKKQWDLSFSDDIYNGTAVEWPIEGPVTISIKCKPNLYYLSQYNTSNGIRYWSIGDLDEQYIAISFEKSISNTNNNQSKQQVLVLPKGSKNTNVIMESSEDLVNWTTDSLGPKNTADGHRFFRLRAVKE